ncbi:MAG TPA: alpha/beta fold hydrolase [Pseudonocardiaceae bacterium]
MGETLRVPGATLHHEVHGSGPTLLIIPGGPTDGGMFAGLGALLADRYTVVTYDPRGLSQSTVDDPAAPVSPRLFADDAAALIRAAGDDPAYVVGFSSGGLVGLELLAHHPSLVRRLVAHEPPATPLLEDAAEHRAEGLRVHETFLEQGVWAAMARFTSGAGLDDTATGPDPEDEAAGAGSDAPGPSEPAVSSASAATSAHAEPDGHAQPAASPEVAEPSPEMADAMAGMQRNMEFFLGNMWMPMLDHVPSLTTAPTGQLVIAVGERSTGQLAHRAAEALATRLDLPLTVFPGDHGFHGVEHQFATRLHEVLTAP